MENGGKENGQAANLYDQLKRYAKKIRYSYLSLLGI
jgi:hypothetical protein